MLNFDYLKKWDFEIELLYKHIIFLFLKTDPFDMDELQLLNYYDFNQCFKDIKITDYKKHYKIYKFIKFDLIKILKYCNLLDLEIENEYWISNSYEMLKNCLIWHELERNLYK